MISERWGTFSVIDHKNATAFVPEVLLYDRLVIPVPSGDTEEQRWRDNGWNPELLYQRLQILDNLVIRIPWNVERRQIFRRKMEEVRDVRFDANNMVNEAQGLPYQVTRVILAQEQQEKISETISKIVVVAAYQSEQDFLADFTIQDCTDKTANLGLLLGHKLAVPSDEDPIKALDKATQLARSSDFKKQRRKLYEWQQDVIKEGIDERAALNEMESMISEYNRCVEAANRKVYYKLAFTVASVGLSLASGALLNPWLAAGSFVSLVQFMTTDRKPIIDAGENEPAAMFHSARKVLGSRGIGNKLPQILKNFINRN